MRNTKEKKMANHNDYKNLHEELTRELTREYYSRKTDWAKIQRLRRVMDKIIPQLVNTYKRDKAA